MDEEETRDLPALERAARFDVDPHRREAIRVKAKAVLRRRSTSLEPWARIYTKAIEPAVAFTACVLYLCWSFSSVNAIYETKTARAEAFDLPAQENGDGVRRGAHPKL